MREKRFLTTQEISVFNKITQLNQILLKHILKGKYLRLDWFDQGADLFVYRPWEMVRKHPWATVACLAAAGFAAYLWWDLYYVPNIQLKNINKNLDVKQFKARRQRGRTCGVHGAYNLMCFIRGQNNDQIEQLLGDGNAFDEAMLVSQRVNRRTDDLSGVQVQRLLDSYDIPAAARANLMVIESTSDNNVLRALDHLEPEVLGLTAAAGVTSVVNIPDAPRRFHAGQTQYFLVNNGAHWLPFAFVPNPSARGGVRVLTAESFFNRNVTNSSIISSLHRFLTGRAPAADHAK